MKIGILLVLAFVLSISLAQATHIVGGGFNMVYKGNYEYSIRLTLYFDSINGSQGAIDEEATFTIFRQSDNFRQLQIDVPLKSRNETIPYDANDCGSATNIKTALLIYETEIFLSPSEFNHPQGYYVMWERCCRNGTITNIVSPGGTGQTFVMTFPPVQKNNIPFVNSSPVFKPAPNNLFCINLLNKVNFSATDADGDSLVYDLVNPLNSITADSIIPRIQDGTPGPYPSVKWRAGYSITNQIPGNPGLTVNSKTGILNVFPNLTGLFVFSVRCSEYRNGVKIGEIRREFQQLVIDCPPNTAPNVFVRDPNKPLNIGNNDTIFISNNGINSNCVQVKITDLQLGQTIRLIANPINFVLAEPISGDTVKQVINPNDTVRLSFCLPGCQGSSKENPFRIRIIARDNGCSEALSDTLEMYLVVTIPPFIPAGLKITPVDTAYILNSFDSLKIQAATLVASGHSTTLELKAFDSKNNLLNLANAGFRFPFKAGTGLLSSNFEFKAGCDSIINQPVTLNFISTTTYCNQIYTSIKKVSLTVKPAPFIPAGLELIPSDSIYTINGLDSLKLLAKTLISTGYPNTLRLDAFDSKNRPVNLSSSGFIFPFRSGTGILNSRFEFKASCDSIENQPVLLNFTSSSTYCNKVYSSSRKVKLQIIPIPIFPAELSLFPPDSFVTVKSLDSLKILTKSGLKPNNTNLLEMEVRDENGDLVNLITLGAKFPSVSGPRALSSLFEWKTPCIGQSSRFYTLNFISKSSFCNKTSIVKKAVRVEVKAEFPLPKVYVAGQDTNLTEFQVDGSSKETTTIQLEGLTINQKNINIKIVGNGDNKLSEYGISFIPLAGFGKVTSPLTWKPECSQSLLPYPFNLQIQSSIINCTSLLADTILLKFKFTENPAIISEPKNLFTTNGDGLNDFFSLSSVLIPGDCELNFEALEIFNRWGKKAYSTTDPSFNWPNDTQEDGIYFYFLKFKEGKFNGWFKIVN
jgi:hypothetical protein